MADRQLDVLVICGSLRKGSYNAALARTLPALAPAGMKLRPAPPFETFPIYNFDIQNSTGFPGEVNTWADAIRSADGVIIVSPEYNWSIPGGLKNAIDWVYKPVALQSAAGGILGASRMQYHLRAHFGRRHPFRQARGHRHLRPAEIRREDARAQG